MKQRKAWWIPFLTGNVLPALGVGALSGLAGTGVQKIIENGLYLKKRGNVCQTETDGRGLYLGPTSGKGFELDEIRCVSDRNWWRRAVSWTNKR